jgi:uncharacterized protein (DUF58 family)
MLQSSRMQQFLRTISNKIRDRFGYFRRNPRVVWHAETPTTQRTIEVQQGLPFLLFLVALVWYLVSPSPVVMMVAVALGGILLCGYLWARAMARGVIGQRRMRFAAMQVGDELEEQISLENKTALPVLWAEFKDRSNIPGYTVSSARAADGKSKVEWRAHTICTRRGIFNLGPWELTVGEPFGIYQVRHLYIQLQEILVYPPLAVLPEHILPHRGARGDHRPLNQPLRAETIASTSVRPYVPGDPLRHIHWRTSARRLDPYVKIFAPETASHVWLVPDFDAAVHVGEGDSSSEETMVTVVASLGAALLQQNLAVGMFANGGGEETVVLPRQGQVHLWPILQALAPLRATPGRTMEDLLSRAQALVSGNDLLVLVTPSLKAEWIGALRRLSRSRGSGGRAEVVLLDPRSFLLEGSFLPEGTEAEAHPTAEEFIHLLMEQGISANLLRRDDVRLISGYYGEVSRWEFAVVGTGRAVARKTPRLAALPGGPGQGDNPGVDDSVFRAIDRAARR